MVQDVTPYLDQETKLHLNLTKQYRYALGLHFKRPKNFTAVSPIIPRLSKQLLSNRELMNCKCLPSVGWQQAATDSFC